MGNEYNSYRGLCLKWAFAFLIVGLAGSAFAYLAFKQDSTVFIQSYHVAFLYCAGSILGLFPILCIHYLTAGSWGVPVRAFGQPATLLAFLIPILFLPIYFLRAQVFPWLNANYLAHHAIVREKATYLNDPFFIKRCLIYMAVWILLAVLINLLPRAAVNNPNKANRGRLQYLGGFGLLSYGLFTSFAVIDWGMSLEPEWFSTIYSLIFLMGQVINAFALLIIIASLFRKHEPIKSIFTEDRCRDMGTLLFAFIMLWAYVSLSQFIIMWCANLAEEAPWYLRRLKNGWKLPAVLLTIVHFLLPFFLLLVRKIKQNPTILMYVSFFVLFARWIDTYWTVMPAFHTKLNLQLLDMAVLFGMGGLLLAIYFFFLAGFKLQIHTEDHKS